jgi:hypothetical protein
VAFVHIDEVELEFAFVFAFYAEIKPSCVAFGVDVVLQDEIEGAWFDWTECAFVDLAVGCK